MIDDVYRKLIDTMKRALCLLALLATAVALCACGSSETATRTVVTVVQKPPVADASSGTGAANGSSGSANRSSASKASGGVSDEGPGGDGSRGKITVPNEAGKQHQAAQDDLQAHGLFNLAEEDATGQDRLLLVDRNWKVVSQSPAAGTKVPEDAAITLSSKKYTDP